MRVCYEKHASETVVFAGEELTRYLQRMAPGLSADWTVILDCPGGTAGGEIDRYRVALDERGGVISGINERSVLLAVYDYLHHLGCRFLMPGRRHEIVPRIGTDKLSASYERQASFRHRGVCIEGADSFENIMDYIEWLPKIGFNSFFLQFKSPYAFLGRWYHHEGNPCLEAEEYAPQNARRDMELLEREIRRRGLVLHKGGHGWTGEALGYRTVSWDAAAETQDRYRHRMAMIGGKRELFGGVPADTNLCYQNEDAVEAFVGLVVSYARDNPQTDYLHVWLADEFNNLCECPDCTGERLSDQYAALLNEIDRRLTAEGLDTKIAFLLYQELLWPPLKERLKNPERFVLMFAPISRTFEKSYELERIAEVPPFVRNHVTLPAGLPENLGFLKAWQDVFDGDSFIYDYPLGRAHYGDFGYIHIAELIRLDIGKLHEMGLDGYISCQELRAAFPNALPNYVMGYALMDETRSAEEIEKEYFAACYGESAPRVTEYLRTLSSLDVCDYVNGKGGRLDPDVAKRMEKAAKCCKSWETEMELHRTEDGGFENIYWELLAYHRDYVLLLSDAIRLLALGDTERADRAWDKMRDFICRNESRYQPYLDVYRVLEVTKKYTGFHKFNFRERVRI